MVYDSCRVSVRALMSFVRTNSVYSGISRRVGDRGDSVRPLAGAGAGATRASLARAAPHRVSPGAGRWHH